MPIDELYAEDLRIGEGGVNGDAEGRVRCRGKWVVIGNLLNGLSSGQYEFNTMRTVGGNRNYHRRADGPDVIATKVSVREICVLTSIWACDCKARRENNAKEADFRRPITRDSEDVENGRCTTCQSPQRGQATKEAGGAFLFVTVSTMGSWTRARCTKTRVF